ncbi:MAG: glycosyltransferase 87 family protein [Pseudomonadota bacterium]
MRRRSWGVVGFLAWWALLAAGLGAGTLGQGQLPVDYRSYVEAAIRANATGSPYTTTDAAAAAWREIHRASVARFDGGEGTAVPGPYIYPPTLALLLAPGPGVAVVYLALLAAAAAALGLLWRWSAGLRSPWWLLALALSPDLLAVFAGGNAEIVVLALAFAAPWLVWQGRGLLAAPLAALALLIKPHAILIFLAVGALGLRGDPRRRRAVWWAVGLGAALMALEALRWPPEARADAWAYLLDPMAYQYFALPPAEQWPMSHWNRAPVQSLVALGLSPELAQALMLSLFAAVVAAASLARPSPRFGAVFALAYTLYIAVKPVTWSLPLFEVVVLGALWPQLGTWGRRAAALLALALALSHWVAFGLFAAARHPGLLTLQSPAVPWETALVLPGAVLLCLYAVASRLRPEAKAR